MHHVGKVWRRIVDVASGRRAMCEEAIWPSLIGSRGVPLIANRILFGEPADYRDLVRREVMDDPSWGIRRFLRLANIAVDKPTHGRNRGCRGAAGSKELDSHITEQLPRIGRRQSHSAGLYVWIIPNRNYGTSGVRIALRSCEP